MHDLKVNNLVGDRNKAGNMLSTMFLFLLLIIHHPGTLIIINLIMYNRSYVIKLAQTTILIITKNTYILFKVKIIKKLLKNKS